jgi:hypothetical protein
MAAKKKLALKSRQAGPEGAAEEPQAETAAAAETIIPDVAEAPRGRFVLDVIVSVIAVLVLIALLLVQFAENSAYQSVIPRTGAVATQ